MADAHVPCRSSPRPSFLATSRPERIAKAKKLKLALTAGIGSDHVDLEAASKAGITVAEVTGAQSVSVATRQRTQVFPT